MKSFISAVLLFSALAVNAETVSLNLPEAGRYIVTIKSRASCMSEQYAITPGETGWSEKKGTAILKATVSQIVETRGRAQWCDQRLNVATGVMIAAEPMFVEINLDGANGELSPAEVKIENISIK